jgi:ABC-type Fe3+-siderophore transport system permease subunit
MLLPRKLGSWTLLVMAFAGGLAVTSLIYALAQNSSAGTGTSMALMLLAGVALLGATLVLLADAVARTIAKPAELPLGVLTAFVGVPFFLLLLRAQRSRIAL